MVTLAYPLPRQYPVTTRYGVPAALGGAIHTGIDFGAPHGTPVLAAAAGVARLQTQMTGGGLGVVIDHGGGVETGYWHLSRRLIRPGGQAVAAGTPIGRVGASGLATGSHLHFEVKTGGRNVDPAPYLGGQAVTPSGGKVCMSTAPGPDGRAQVKPMPASGVCPTGFGAVNQDALGGILGEDVRDAFRNPLAFALGEIPLLDLLPLLSSLAIIVVALIIGWTGVRQVLGIR